MNGIRPLTTPQIATRAFIQRVLDAKRWTANRLAKEAGLSPATVHRAMHDERFVTSTTTLDKIARAAGMTWQMAGARSTAQGGFAEAEATRFTAEADMPDSLKPADNEGVWRLSTRAAELAGYLPGDLVLVRQGIEARAGDLVCVQVYNLQMDTAETVWRVFEPPYVVPRTMDPQVSPKPLLVDGERVMIWGVVLKCLRVRS